MQGEVLTKIKKFFADFHSKYLSGITIRWVLNVFAPVVSVVVFSCLILSVFISNFYTASARSSLKTEAESAAKYFETFVYPQYRDFTTCAQILVSDFDKKSIMEMQVSNLSGKNVFSSTGFAVSDVAISPDVIAARSGTTSFWQGHPESKSEHIYSVAVPVHNTDGRICGTIRMVASIENMENFLTTIYWIIGAVGFFIVALTAFSGLYFVKSIVIPVGEINKVALNIAKGNLNSSLLKDTSNDEIGQLCRNINHMARELADSQKIKNDFISQISHELRTPITAIRGWSETMMADDKLDELSHRGVSIINSETNRLSKMVEEMLDMSRMQSGRLSITPSIIDAIAEFEDTVFMMSERAKGEKINIVYQMNVTDCMVNGDTDRLKQVFFNIIDNAIKHSNPGADINVTTSRTDDKISFIIEDFGAGISKEDLPYIKEMFYKGSSQKRGSGIGLGVSDEIVRLHGGTLDIESELGIGTTVTVTLPVFEETADDDEY